MGPIRPDRLLFVMASQAWLCNVLYTASYRHDVYAPFDCGLRMRITILPRVSRKQKRHVNQSPQQSDLPCSPSDMIVVSG